MTRAKEGRQELRGVESDSQQQVSLMILCCASIFQIGVKSSNSADDGTRLPIPPGFVTAYEETGCGKQGGFPVAIGTVAALLHWHVQGCDSLDEFLTLSRRYRQRKLPC